MPTVYEYNNQELFKDDGDAYTIEEIQRHYSQHFPELAQSTYTVTPATESEPRKVIFAKKVGTKGAGLDPVVERLLTIKASPIAALDLLHRLNAGEFDRVADLINLAPEIQEALVEIERISEASKKVVQRCLLLPSVPHKSHGF